ncbi:hypothetical protein EYF80_063773 [Liparis tanakae]|uniref:Uncharacterized protein n=1 Tax=Liparis tanakae TaxID=230148 RepID=A0A4Z2EBG4_9TELE|nr:hypothetical protein EYF80_063773 [Liparis tanakae]
MVPVRTVVAACFLLLLPGCRARIHKLTLQVSPTPRTSASSAPTGVLTRKLTGRRS